MTREEAKHDGWEFFAPPPRAARDLIRQAITGEVLGARCGVCGGYTSTGYLEMEDDSWCCEPCMEAMPLPENAEEAP